MRGRKRRRPEVVIVEAPKALMVPRQHGAGGFARYAAKLTVPSEWLSRFLPESLRWLAKLDWAVLISFGLGMIQVDEYLVATVFWALSILVLIARAFTWRGIISRPRFTALARFGISAAAIVFFGFMTIWTAAKKSEKPWSILLAGTRAARTEPQITGTPIERWIATGSRPVNREEQAKAALRKKAEAIIGDLLGKGDAAQAIYTQATRGQVDALSAVQGVNRWRGEAGEKLKTHPFKAVTEQYVLGQAGSLIDDEVHRLRDVLAHLDQWLDFTEVAPSLPKLYYADRELSGATITLERSNPDPRLCTTMHVWATMPTGIPDSFGLCGVWMKKPDDAATVTAFALYIDFSEEITDRQGACRISNEKPEPGYKVALICQAWPIPSPTRWTLPAFFGLPIPTKDTKIRMRFEYGNRNAEVTTFILRPPEPG